MPEDSILCYIPRFINPLILYETVTNYLSSRRSTLLYLFTERAINLIGVISRHIIVISFLQHFNLYLSRLTPDGVTGEKMEYSETVHQRFIDCKKAYDLVRREVLCSLGVWYH
jgi:hypothetical protein